MQVQQVETEQIISSTFEHDCKAFGQAYDSNEEECMECLDASDCKRTMEEAAKPKPAPKKKKENKVEAKVETVKEVKRKVIEIFSKSKKELKEYTAATLYHDVEYVEQVEVVAIKKKVNKVAGKGMRKPPFNGRGGKGNTASYIEWLLYSGKWTFEELVKKGNYYLERHGAKPVSTPMNTYIKSAIIWLKKNKDAKETISEDKRIMVRI
jgi:hypothetical protein